MHWKPYISYCLFMELASLCIFPRKWVLRGEQERESLLTPVLTSSSIWSISELRRRQFLFPSSSSYLSFTGRKTRLLTAASCLCTSSWQFPPPTGCYLHISLSTRSLVLEEHSQKHSKESCLLGPCASNSYRIICDSFCGCWNKKFISILAISILLFLSYM